MGESTRMVVHTWKQRILWVSHADTVDIGNAYICGNACYYDLRLSRRSDSFTEVSVVPCIYLSVLLGVAVPYRSVLVHSGNLTGKWVLNVERSWLKAARLKSQSSRSLRCVGLVQMGNTILSVTMNSWFFFYDPGPILRNPFLIISDFIRVGLHRSFQFS